MLLFCTALFVFIKSKSYSNPIVIYKNFDISYAKFIEKK